MNVQWIITSPENLQTHLKELEETGITILPSAIPIELIDKIRGRFQEYIDMGELLSQPRDLRNVDANMEQLNIPRLNNKDFERGESFYRNVCDNIQLKDPLINIPDVLDVALNHTIMSSGNAFFGTLPKLTYLKPVRNYANTMSSFDTQFYHYDENAIKLLKAFVYLNDVTEEEHGPFCYVKRSHFAAEENWGKSVR